MNVAGGFFVINVSKSTIRLYLGNVYLVFQYQCATLTVMYC